MYKSIFEVNYENNNINTILEMQEQILLEESIINTIMDDVPVVSRPEFIKQSKPGDIMVSYLKDAGLFSNFLAKAQGSPYTSSKLIMSKKQVIGYGVTGPDSKNATQVGIDNFAAVLDRMDRACLIRIKDSTKEKQKKVIHYIYLRLGMDYDTIGLLKSAWDRFVSRKFIPFFSKLSKANVEDYKEPLICSTIISFACKYAGYKINFSDHELDVWPKDFILTPHTTKICQIK